jgi:choline kinase/phosphatidylglycerophosphate synthase
MDETYRNSICALVLAAGEGRRLRKYTNSKPLLRVAGIPLLGRILHSLKEAGLQDVWIAVGYKANMIRQQIGENYAGLRIRYIKVRHRRKGNLYSLLAAQEIFQQNFLLCMGDHVFDPEIPKKLINIKFESAIVLAIDKVPEADTKVLEQSGIILEIGKKINHSNVAIDTGFFLCSPKVFEYANQAIKEGKPELADCVRIAGLSGDAKVVDVSGHSWADVDTLEDLDRAKKLIVENAQKKRGASDFVAYYFNRPIENTILHYISDWLFITPNRLTIATNILAWFITYLFFSGHLGLGALLTFVVGVIDGLDGKLARIRWCSTKLGLMEHPFDILYEFSWLVAFGLFLSQSEGLLPLGLVAGSIMFIAFYRSCYDQFSRATGISLDIYGRFERSFRRVSGRRNIYNVYILIGVLLGVPLYSLIGILLHSSLTAIVYACGAGVHLHAIDKAKKDDFMPKQW